jgi:transcriptional regulator
MYLPRTFREDKDEQLHDLIENYSFGTLIVALPNDELEISHVPFLLDRNSGTRGKLRLHVARANPIWKCALKAQRVTAVFSGPHAYVSANWYEHPSEQVPTWNYAIVHAEGTPAELGRDELIELLDDLSIFHEPNVEDAWRTSLLSPEFRDELLQQIVGLSIEVTVMRGKFKLSQNRSDSDRLSVIAGLERRMGPGDLELAKLMAPRT